MRCVRVARTMHAEGREVAGWKIYFILIIVRSIIKCPPDSKIRSKEVIEGVINVVRRARSDRSQMP